MSEENVAPASAPASAPESTGNWKESLPEPLRDAPWIGKADSLEAAVGQLQDAAQYLGNAIRIPSEDAGDSDMAAFREKLLSREHIGLMPKPKQGDDVDVLRALGMPEKAEQYDVAGIDHAPEGERLGQLRAMAHEAKMTAGQFKKWVAELSAADYKTQEQMEYERGQQMKELQGEWGSAYDQKVGFALKAAEATQAPDFVMEMLRSGTADPKTLRWLSNTYDQLVNDAPQGAVQGKDVVPELTPAEAEARLGEIERRLFDRATPKHEIPMLNEKRLKLIKLSMAGG